MLIMTLGLMTEIHMFFALYFITGEHTPIRNAKSCIVTLPFYPIPETLPENDSFLLQPALVGLGLVRLSSN